MTIWRDDPDRAADALIDADELGLTRGERVLLVDASAALPHVFVRRGLAVETWDRRVAHERAATGEAPAGPFDAVLLRLVKSKDELEMRAHQAFATLAPGGRMIVYGGNDEGIKTIGKRLAALGPATTLATRGHGRILSFVRGDTLCVFKSAVGDWRRDEPVTLFDAEPRSWATYPGLFADGALDAGTALLLGHVGTLNAGGRVLDYGCGTGLVARVLLDREPALRMCALDVDSLAVLATAQNVPEAQIVLSDKLKGAGRFDLIVSNPPIHRGFREYHGILHQLIEDAPKHLLPGGRLVIVVQRRVPVDAQLKAQFGSVAVAADDGPYRVWTAAGKPAVVTLRTAGSKTGTSTTIDPSGYVISDEVEPW